MNRLLLFLHSLCLIAALSACATQLPGSVSTLPTGDVQTLHAPSRTARSSEGAGPDQQAMDGYLDTVTLASTLTFEESVASEKAVLHAHSDRQATDRNLDTITLVSILAFEESIASDLP